VKFRNLSIKNKLIAISMLTAVVSLFVVLVFNVVGVYFSYRSSITDRAMSFARVIGANCTAALIFDDQKSAEDTLKSLKSESNIDYARVFSTEGKIFAEYKGKGRTETAYFEKGWELEFQAMFKKELPQCHFGFLRGGLQVFMPIVSDNKVVGAIEIYSNLKALRNTLFSLTVMSLLAVFFSTLIAYLVSIVYQRYISGPILTLTRAMAKVSQDNDYAIRVEKENSDELGLLFQGFNDMLSEIQDRDEKLYFVQFTVDHMKDAMYWIDPTGKVVNANASASLMLGYSREEFLSMSINDLDPKFSMDSWKELWNLFREIKSVAFETQNIAKDGKIIPVEVNISYLNFREKEYSCAIIRDLTDKRKLQGQLEQAQKMEAIGTLAGGVAHDLNNILGAVIGYPQIMLLEMPDDSPLRPKLLTIQKSGQKAAAVVQDMLTLARRGVELQNAVNLNEIVSEYLNSPELKSLKETSPQIRFESYLQEDLPNILGSDFHIGKALMNLTTNAAEAMTLGGGVVEISTANHYIERSFNGYQSIPPGHYAVLSVRDEGSGISPKDRENIFEPFYTKKIMGKSGTGLGMTVVAGVVKDHRGFIDLTSAVGSGSRFDLYFPITEEVIQKKESIQPIESYGGTESILVVDDIPEQREVACMVLKRLGYQVSAVTGGEEALEFLKENPVELLILDMIMDPGIDGLETYRRVLSHHPGQKAIIATGYAETERVKTALSLGVGAYVKKPYTIENLGIAVRGVLDA
jgi:PAS domain S-box-containing protein